MNEASVTARLVQAVRSLPGFVVFKHNDAKTAGIPDVSVTARGLTTWIEVKVGETIEGRQVQEITMMRLDRASQGGAIYVLYSEGRTLIIKPGGLLIDSSDVNHDHKLVCAWLIKRHCRA